MIAALTRAVLVLLLFAPAVRAADDVKAVSTPGQGDLTMCPVSWVYHECNLYHHIEIPPRIAVGDTVKVHFGSNPKRYNFPVARIVRDGDRCTAFSQTSETEKVEKIEIGSCGGTPSAQ
ncbi:MAG TPA: hypothetical protein VFC56_03535 [Stellaceae bacterium]|nr:hypothetical protein [Stellaceae bacterium]